MQSFDIAFVFQACNLLHVRTPSICIVTPHASLVVKTCFWLFSAIWHIRVYVTKFGIYIDQHAWSYVSQSPWQRRHHWRSSFLCCRFVRWTHALKGYHSGIYLGLIESFLWFLERSRKLSGECRAWSKPETRCADGSSMASSKCTLFVLINMSQWLRSIVG